MSGLMNDQNLGGLMMAEPELGGLMSRGYILPLGRKKDGSMTWAVPGFAMDAYDAFTLPGDVYAGHQRLVTPEGQYDPQAIKRVTDLAGAVTLGAGAVPSGANTLRAGIKAYHGSPHDFDQFDMSKIGTGEGVQAYGHGLYFAENEGVARSYRDTLAKKASADPFRVTARTILAKHGGDREKALAHLRTSAEAFGDTPRGNSFRYAAEALEGGASIDDISGHMYEVNIHADPDAFLDWDAPLSAQSPKVQEYFRQRMDKVMPGREGWDPDGDMLAKLASPQSDLDGRDWLDTGPQEWATQQMREAGIPGIKYLDQGSRVAGEGSRNFVVFDPEIIKIVRKYGIVAALAGGLLTQEQADEMRAQGIADL